MAAYELCAWSSCCRFCIPLPLKSPPASLQFVTYQMADASPSGPRRFPLQASSETLNGASSMAQAFMQRRGSGAASKDANQIDRRGDEHNAAGRVGGGAALQRIAALRGGLPTRTRSAAARQQQHHPTPRATPEYEVGDVERRSESCSSSAHRSASANDGGRPSVGNRVASRSPDKSHSHYPAFEQRLASHQASRSASVEKLQYASNGLGDGRSSIESAGFTAAGGKPVVANFEDLPAGVRTRQEAGVFNENAVPPVDETPPEGMVETPTAFGEGSDEAPRHLPGNKPSILRRGEGQRRIIKAHQQARQHEGGGEITVDPSVLGGVEGASRRPPRTRSVATDRHLTEDPHAEVVESPTSRRLPADEEPLSPSDPHASTLRPKELPKRQLPTPQRRPPSVTIPGHLLNGGPSHTSLESALLIASHNSLVFEHAEGLDSRRVDGLFDEGLPPGASVEGSVMQAEELLVAFLDSKRLEFLRTQLTYPLDATNRVFKHVPRFGSAEEFLAIRHTLPGFDAATRILDHVGIQ